MDVRVEPDPSKDRLADYFLLVGPSDSLSPVLEEINSPRGAKKQAKSPVLNHGGNTGNKGTNESTKWHPLKTRFKAFVLDRYPFSDYQNSPFLTGAPMFCFPRGVRLRCTESCSQPLPIFFTFVSTNGTGQRIYGHVLVFWEETTPQQCQNIDTTIVGENKNQFIFAPKCLCIISRWNFDEFKTFLTELYRLSFASLDVPLERYIGNFMTEVPLPPPGILEVQYNIGNATISLKRPPANHRISPMGLHFHEVFECLSLDNIVLLVRALVCERQVFLHSSQHSLLSMTAEVLTALMYPFHWVGAYIPVLPRGLIQAVHAPVPFLVGAPTDTWREIGDLPPQVVQVDLDRNYVFVHGGHPVPQLPSKQRTKLMRNLAARANVYSNRIPDWEKSRLPNFDIAFPFCPRPCDVFDDGTTSGTQDIDWHEVRASFLRLWLSLFMNYRKHVVPISRENPYPKERFKSDAFLSESPKEAQPLLNQIISTQSFSAFVDERTNPETIGNADVVFVDESIAAKLNRHLLSKWKGVNKETPFLDSREFEIRRTVVAMGPDTGGLEPDRKYTYCPFPCLNPQLFVSPRKLSNQLEGRGSCLRTRSCTSEYFNAVSSNNSNSNDVLSAFNLDQSKWEHADENEKWRVIESGIYVTWFVIFGTLLKNDLSYPVLNAKRTEIVTPVLKITKEGTKLKHESSVGGDGMFTPTKDDSNREGWDPAVNVHDISIEVKGGKSRKSDEDRPHHRRGNSSFEFVQRHSSLDVAFRIFDTLQTRNIPISPIIFKILLDVCGTVGTVDGATQVLRAMARSGETPDHSIFACLFRAFSMDPEAGKLPLGAIDWRQFENSEKKEMGKRSNSLSVSQNGASGDSIRTDNIPFQIVKQKKLSARYVLSFRWMLPSKPVEKGSYQTEEDCGEETTDNSEDKPNARERIPVNYPSLLEYLFPDLSIEINPQPCPANEHMLDFNDICSGWDADPNSYTTICKHCIRKERKSFSSERNVLRNLSIAEYGDEESRDASPPSSPKATSPRPASPKKDSNVNQNLQYAGERFVPRFIVRSSSNHWRGSSRDGPNSPLYVEYLSPWTLYKELQASLNRATDSEDAVQMLANLRQEAEVVYWNMVFWFSYFGLHTNFLSSIAGIPIPDNAPHISVPSEANDRVASTETPYNSGRIVDP